MSQNPLISVVIPTYNRPNFLREALESLKQQSYSYFEALVVNDAGENVKAIIDGLNDKRFIYVEHDTNKGLPAARNTALKLAKGKYIAYLDDDDVYLTDHLQTAIEAFSKNNSDIIYVNCMDVSCELKKEKIIRSKLSERCLEMNPDTILVSNMLPPICFLHKRECLQQTGFFDESLKRYEDWDFYIRLSQNYSFEHVAKTTVCYTVESYQKQMINSWTGHFLYTMQIIHARYKSFVKGRPSIILLQCDEREKLRYYSLVELKRMPDADIVKMEIESLMADIVESSLHLFPEDIRGAWALCGYLSQRLPKLLLVKNLYEQLSQALNPKNLLKNEEIHERGYWQTPDVIYHHYFDPLLALALITFLKDRKAESIVDFGCGFGDYIATFIKADFQAEGYDGNPLTPTLTDGLANVQDLTIPFDLGKLFDWVLCLEVGEHIPKEFEEVLIENIIRHCRQGVILSWAVEGQGGYGHVNEKSNESVKRLFREKGLINDIQAENWLRNFSSLRWFKNTIMVFKF